jgi:hypothetical protein
LEGLNPASRASDAVKTDQPVAKELAFEVPAVMLTGHAPTRFE